MYRKNFIEEYLKNNFTFEEARSEVDYALDVLFNYTYKEYMLGKSLTDWQIIKLEKVINERINTSKPIQQIIGQAYFYGRKFFVNEYTLIPRPETELVVKEVLKICEEENGIKKILDIGSGTGCIGITLALENSGLEIKSVDVCSEALEISKKNALIHNVNNKIEFIKSDIYQNIDSKFDIIVSNPPYIPLKDKPYLQKEVRDWENPQALYTQDEFGMEFYEKILKNVREHILNGGYVVFEIGLGQAERVTELIKSAGMAVQSVVKDMNSIERVVVGKFINKN